MKRFQKCKFRDYLRDLILLVDSDGKQFDYLKNFKFGRPLLNGLRNRMQVLQI
jgi:hypothetical protein